MYFEKGEPLDIDDIKRVYNLYEHLLETVRSYRNYIRRYELSVYNENGSSDHHHMDEFTRDHHRLQPTADPGCGCGFGESDKEDFYLDETWIVLTEDILPNIGGKKLLAELEKIDEDCENVQAYKSEKANNALIEKFKKLDDEIYEKIEKRNALLKKYEKQYEKIEERIRAFMEKLVPFLVKYNEKVAKKKG